MSSPAFLACAIALVGAPPAAQAAFAVQRGKVNAASWGRSVSVSDAAAAANPIRKVVLMLQSMEKKVQEEGQKNRDLYDKFMCYCKSSGSSVKGSIAAAESKVPQVGSSITEAEEQKVQAQADLKQAQTDRSAAKAAMASASALREKEAAAYSSEKVTFETNIAALKKAVAAIDRGSLGSFLQTATAQAVRKLALDSEHLEEQDRRDVLAFFSTRAGHDEAAPGSGEITGILREMASTMGKDLEELTATENEAVKTFTQLMHAKEKEVDVLTSSIEQKTVQIGELGVSIVQMKNDLTETQAAMLEDQKFLADMTKQCGSKTAEYQEAERLRSEELVAISETIKILNDDDAMELFKKTLPATGSSFMQLQKNAAKSRMQALALLKKARPSEERSHLDFITLVLQGKTVGFEKVIGMIDSMVKTLKKEQHDDEHKKEYCAMQLDFSEDKKKGLERNIANEETAIASATEGIASLKEEIKALEDGIKALDKEVVKAAEQRKEEHEVYTETLASNSAARELLLFAKNRMNKFYNKALYKQAAKVELSEEGRIEASISGTEPPTEAPGGIANTGVTVFTQVGAVHTSKRDAPEAPAAYSKKTEESNGVIAMMDLLIKDLDADITESKVIEKDSQSGYESTMRDAASKRAQDSRTLTEKTSTLAELGSALEEHKENKAMAGKELFGVLAYIQQLHNECDWLIKYFDVRKQARDEEIDGLVKAKAVLNGADYSFLQGAKK